jgi:diguanylate cyclase (GGDEF)-like protein
VSGLTAWCGQSDDFDWMTEFLRQRGWLRPAQRIMMVVAGSAALVPLTVMATHRYLSAAAVAAGGFTIVFTVGMTTFWLKRWPTRRQSVAAVTLGMLCIAAWSLIQPTAALAALACTPMVVTGGYTAIFHNAKLTLLNGLVAFVITTWAVLRLAHEANVATAADAFWLINFLVVSVSCGVCGMSRALRTYVQRSDEDALTGLLNRRAFGEMVSHRLGNPPRVHTHLAVVMLDIDNFKRINDTHGHPAGDHALRTVAELLREQAPADAVICRAGGEEYLIALTCIASDVGALAHKICTAIGKLSLNLTASIGTAIAELHLPSGPHGAGILEELITIADRAMYAAKRSGGNRAHHGATI